MLNTREFTQRTNTYPWEGKCQKQRLMLKTTYSLLKSAMPPNQILCYEYQSLHSLFNITYICCCILIEKERLYKKYINAIS